MIYMHVSITRLRHVEQEQHDQCIIIHVLKQKSIQKSAALLPWQQASMTPWQPASLAQQEQAIKSPWQQQQLVSP